MHAQVTLVTKLAWSVAVHELELQSDLAGDSTISTLGRYILAGCLASCFNDRKAR